MRAALTTAGEIAGILLVTVGIALVFVPAALIFLGVAVAFVSYWNGR